MQFEMTDSTCALCKSGFAPTADAYPGPSRLCGRCRQLVQTILPRTGLYAAAETAAVLDTAAAPEELPFVEVVKDDPVLEDDFDYREDVGAGEPSFFRPEEESYYRTDLEIQPDTGELDDFVEDFPGAPHESVALESPVDDLADLPDQGPINFSSSDSLHNEDSASGNGSGHASGEWQNITQGYGAQPASEYIPATTAPLTGETTHELAQDDFWLTNAETITDTAQAPAAQASNSNEAVTDPWEEPLPAWDYSRNEYPVLLSPKRPSRRRKLWPLIAVGLLIVAVIAAYFLLSRPNSPRTESANAQNSSAESNGDSAASAAQPLPAPIATEQQSAPAQASPDISQAQAPATSPTEFGSVGTLTLQSAAFPDESGADEFSKRLIRAGVPAYVVPADLAGKGRWFRVRVGRFTKAEEAKKYAAQSRLRAKAAGMKVAFIVVEYGKP